MSSSRLQHMLILSLGLLLWSGAATALAYERSSQDALVMGIVTGLLGIALAVEVLRRVRRNLRQALRVASRQHPGTAPKFADALDDEFYRLGQRLDQSSQLYEARFEELTEEQNRIHAVLNNMIEGIILCDEESTILVWNAAFNRLFEVEGEPREKKIYEVCRVPEVLRLSSRILASKEPLASEFDYGQLIVRTRFVPLLGGGYLAVFHDITEMRRTDRVRRDFVANVSHELRTPLASISGYSESLLEGALDDTAVARKFVDAIYRNADRLTQLIEDLLDLSRIESGRLQFNFTPVDLKDAVGTAVHGISRIKTKEQTFQNAIEPEMRTVTDRKALLQILVNLIENASKYTQPGSTIRVEATEEPNSTMIRVIDNGPGIPPTDLPRIFERFYRGDKSRNSAGEPGTGLGLSICKHLVSELGGAIDVKSSRHGTTFSVMLPKT